MKNYFYDVLPVDIQEEILSIAKIKNDFDMVVTDIAVSIYHEINYDGKGSTLLSWIERGNKKAPNITTYHMDYVYNNVLDTRVWNWYV